MDIEKMKYFATYPVSHALSVTYALIHFGPPVFPSGIVLAYHQLDALEIWQGD